jgi:hypothetical protein
MLSLNCIVIMDAHAAMTHREAFNTVVSNSNNGSGDHAKQETPDDSATSLAHPLLVQLNQADYPQVKFWD